MVGMDGVALISTWKIIPAARNKGRVSKREKFKTCYLFGKKFTASKFIKSFDCWICQCGLFSFYKPWFHFYNWEGLLKNRWQLRPTRGWKPDVNACSPGQGCKTIPAGRKKGLDPEIKQPPPTPATYKCCVKLKQSQVQVYHFAHSAFWELPVPCTCFALLSAKSDVASSRPVDLKAYTFKLSKPFKVA